MSLGACLFVLLTLNVPFNKVDYIVKHYKDDKSHTITIYIIGQELTEKKRFP